MAKSLLPDALWARIAPLLLPPEPPDAQGWTAPGVGPGGADGYPARVEDGQSLGVLACREGCGSEMTCWRRLRNWYQAGVWRRLHLVLLKELAQAGRIEWGRAALDSGAMPALGGQETGKNLTDRGKQVY